MEHNLPTGSYFIQIDEPIQTIQLAETVNPLVQEIPSECVKKSLNFIGQNELLLLPDYSLASVNPTLNTISGTDQMEMVQEESPYIYQIVYPQDLNLQPANLGAKRGRPRKKKVVEEEVSDAQLLVKEVQKPPINPKKCARTRSGRLVQVPKHIEKNFKRIEITSDEQDVQVSDFQRAPDNVDSGKQDFLELGVKKRQISAQYRCSKCLKAYLGKNRMIQHLQKYPDHGPAPETQKQYNFDVWNFLFDITQKSKPGQRGAKFCEELSNLLHNLLLLKSALFKTVTDNKNCVQIDKVLGNAIGLTPGKYKFNENELYKDVTVLKLITNTDFFKPNITKSTPEDETTIKDKSHIGDTGKTAIFEVQNETSTKHQKTEYSNEVKLKSSNENATIYSCTPLSGDPPPNPEPEESNLQSEILSDNLLLNSLPNPRTTVDDMLSAVDNNSSNLLDTSTGSDEVMNVDQFVNERFKRIIEPDIEITNSSLNIDLPSLELFHFHTN